MKKIFILLLVALMLVSMFACKKTNDEMLPEFEVVETRPPETQPPVETITPEETEPPVVEATPEVPEVQYVSKEFICMNSSLTSKDFDGIDFDKFVALYELTEESFADGVKPGFFEALLSGYKLTLAIVNGEVDTEPTPEVVEPTNEPIETEEPDPTATAIPNNQQTVTQPTKAPTAVPTQKPTSVPTQKPTSAPTQKPTAAPTQKPTQAPTQKPTSTPTSKPTAVPTATPIQYENPITITNLIVSELDNGNASVQVHFSHKSGERYKIFRKTTGSYTVVADITTNSFIEDSHDWWTDKTVEWNKEYYYYVMHYSKDGKTALSDKYNERTVKTFFDAYSINNISYNASNSVITITWTGGGKYFRVFRKVGNGSWERAYDYSVDKGNTDSQGLGLANQAHYSFYDKVDKVPGTYKYAVRRITKDGKTYISDDGVPKSFTIDVSMLKETEESVKIETVKPVATGSTSTKKIKVTFVSEPGEVYAVFKKCSSQTYQWKDGRTPIVGEDKYINNGWSEPTLITATSNKTDYSETINTLLYSHDTTFTYTVAHVAKDKSVYLSKYNGKGTSIALSEGFGGNPVEIAEGEELFGTFDNEAAAKECANLYRIKFVKFQYATATFTLKDGETRTLQQIINEGKTNGWPLIEINYVSHIG